jgi:hypothetical protein
MLFAGQPVILPEEQPWESPTWTSQLYEILDDKLCRFLHLSINAGFR